MTTLRRERALRAWPRIRPASRCKRESPSGPADSGEPGRRHRAPARSPRSPPTSTRRQREGSVRAAGSDQNPRLQLVGAEGAGVRAGSLAPALGSTAVRTRSRASSRRCTGASLPSSGVSRTARSNATQHIIVGREVLAARVPGLPHPSVGLPPQCARPPVGLRIEITDLRSPIRSCRLLRFASQPKPSICTGGTLRSSARVAWSRFLMRSRER